VCWNIRFASKDLTSGLWREESPENAMKPVLDPNAKPRTQLYRIPNPRDDSSNKECKQEGNKKDMYSDTCITSYGVKKKKKR
jgi:hypothetical protein